MARSKSKKKNGLERFGEKALELNQKPVPNWVNISAEILLGWVPLVVILAIGVVAYFKYRLLIIPIGILFLLILLTFWAARSAKVSRPVNRLRLPALGVMLLVGFFMTGDVAGNGTKASKKTRKNR